MSYMDQEYREIITKAVCGRGRKLTTTTNHVLPAHKPSSILGCWVINHAYHAKQKGPDSVEIHGSYHIHIWYSFNDNTKTEVVSEKIDYCDEIKVTTKDANCINNNYDIIAKVIKQPNCLQCKIQKEGNEIAVEVEREFVVKIIGETKVNVKVGPVSFDDRYDKKERDDFRKEEDRSFIKGKRI